ncbi:hypothetical protein MVEN_00009300 [Mycena venus]|uniref:Uncharacterized protein n=1 Tax=Mycena venus TaxID=2733690 RepID=A0A8H6Z3C6_9AGAR|nr:hypothetical protein MVEN_00009300 [Mycena venus]
MDPHALRATLRCEVCRCTLTNPTTLSCGHTVCAHHPTFPCPLCQCTAPAVPACPRILSTSRIDYCSSHPPAPLPPQPLDVTINKILMLLNNVLGHNSHDDRGSSDRDKDSPPLIPTVRHPPDSASAPDRARKRQRLHDSYDDNGDLYATSQAFPDRSPTPQNLEKEMQTELSCEICFMLLYSPVTTPCQHTFCAKCLHRALDHSTHCPLCRENVPGFSFFDDHPVNQTLETLLVTAFPEEYAARGDAIAAEERDARLNTPIFVCMLIFPGHPTALHFFEPRYRLMLRRCFEQDVPSFGMIMPVRQSAGAGVADVQTDYGTMLEVRSVQMLAGGRIFVETWSTYRFRILERGQLDGYTVGRIERIDDIADSLALGLLEPSNEQYMDTCTKFLQRFRLSTAPWVMQRLNNAYGTPPVDPTQFAYWVALVLPIDEFEKAKLLPIRSARLRLRLVVHWIEQLDNSWWFRSGCVNF